jgi:hypothetical protein
VITTAFHNSCKANGQYLLDFEAAARSQEALIMEVFNKHRVPMAYFEVAANVNMNECSLKRSLTNLCNDRKTKAGVVTRKAMLRITHVQVMGPEGKACHRYELI